MTESALKRFNLPQLAARGGILLRAFLSDGSEDTYYSKVLYRHPPVKCSESAKGWSESDDHEAEVREKVLCLEPL
ncbi:hypothetical protein GCM10015535_65100 [Streptomyces gelaticus]|uniref:Uncharacterized protein n=1 Tax=Streptomyces gelaticus TaxID=285446 RepID=A0ABQ2W8U8_9ACTN|nr:hypothetical protein [Streptomyces gelaticus]GGV96140.1 hypothetical protein GCM10015535_65100 [Streptomyces gelaticus]